MLILPIFLRFWCTKNRYFLTEILNIRGYILKNSENGALCSVFAMKQVLFIEYGGKAPQRFPPVSDIMKTISKPLPILELEADMAWNSYRNEKDARSVQIAPFIGHFEAIEGMWIDRLVNQAQGEDGFILQEAGFLQSGEESLLRIAETYISKYGLWNRKGLMSVCNSMAKAFYWAFQKEKPVTEARLNKGLQPREISFK